MKIEKIGTQTEKCDNCNDIPAIFKISIGKNKKIKLCENCTWDLSEMLIEEPEEETESESRFVIIENPQHTKEDDYAIKYKMDAKDKTLAGLAEDIIFSYNSIKDFDPVPGFQIHAARYIIKHTGKGFCLIEEDKFGRACTKTMDKQLSAFLQNVFFIVGGHENLDINKVLVTGTVTKTLRSRFGMDINTEVLSGTETDMPVIQINARPANDIERESLKKIGFIYKDDKWALMI